MKRFRLTTWDVAPLSFVMSLAILGELNVGARAGDVYVQSNLVSDIQGTAAAFDPNLKDPWGVSFSKGSPFWVSDQASNVNGSSVTTIYSVDGKTGGLNVVPFFPGVPNQGGAAPNPATNGPTGQVNTNAPGISTSPTDFPLNGNSTVSGRDQGSSHLSYCAYET